MQVTPSNLLFLCIVPLFTASTILIIVIIITVISTSCNLTFLHRNTLRSLAVGVMREGVGVAGPTVNRRALGILVVSLVCGVGSDVFRGGIVKLVLTNTC